MSKPVIANASPLTLLARSGQFDLLRAMGERLLVPAVVVSEIERRGDADVAVRSLRRCDCVQEKGHYRLASPLGFDSADDALRAAERLLKRRPDAQVWLARIGYRALHRIGAWRDEGSAG